MRDVDAVGRRAVDLVDALAQPLHAQRTAQRQRVADGAGFDVRRNDDDLAEPRERARQRVDALRVHAVIVGDENLFHRKTKSIAAGSRPPRERRRRETPPCGETRVQIRPKTTLDEQRADADDRVVVAERGAAQARPARGPRSRPSPPLRSTRSRCRRRGTPTISQALAASTNANAA